MSGLKEKAGTASWRWIRRSTTWSRENIIPQMRYEPLMDNEEQHIAEMAAYFSPAGGDQKHLGMLVLFASGRAMNRFLEHADRSRLMLLVQGDQPRYRLVELHRKR